MKHRTFRTVSGGVLAAGTTLASVLFGIVVNVHGAGPNQLWGVVGYPQYSMYVWENGSYVTNAGITYPGGQPNQMANLWHTNQVLHAFENTLITRNASFSYGQEYDGNGSLGTINRSNLWQVSGVGLEYTGSGYWVGAQPTRAWLSSRKNLSGTAGAYIYDLDLSTDTVLSQFNAEVQFSPGLTNRQITQVQVNPVTKDIYAVYGNDYNPANGYWTLPGGIARWSSNGTLLDSDLINMSSYALAINPVNHHLLMYVNQYEQRIREYDADLNLLSTFQIFNEQNQFRYGGSLTFDMDGRLFVSGSDATFTNWRIYEYATTNSTFATTDLVRSYWGAPTGTSPGVLAYNWQIPEPSALTILTFGSAVMLAGRRKR